MRFVFSWTAMVLTAASLAACNPSAETPAPASTPAPDSSTPGTSASTPHPSAPTGAAADVKPITPAGGPGAGEGAPASTDPAQQQNKKP